MAVYDICFPFFYIYIFQLCLYYGIVNIPAHSQQTQNICITFVQHRRWSKIIHMLYADVFVPWVGVHLC